MPEPGPAIPGLMLSGQCLEIWALGTTPACSGNDELVGDPVAGNDSRQPGSSPTLGPNSPLPACAWKEDLPTEARAQAQFPPNTTPSEGLLPGAGIILGFKWIRAA